MRKTLISAHPPAVPEDPVPVLSIWGTQWALGVCEAPDSQENTSFNVCMRTVSREKVHGFQEILSGIRNPK